MDGLHEEHVRVMTIGRTDELPKKTRDAREGVGEDEGQRRDDAGRGRELRRPRGAARRYAVLHGRRACRVARGREPEPLSEATLSRHLYTADIPDPDLLIRTSGEMRVSNFLLWQIAYSEFVCTETLWPDFDRYEFLRALLEFQSRDRRFGAVK